MTMKKLPKGSKQVGAWIEVSSEAYPKGWNNEVTVCYYDADIEYADGIVGTATMVTIYDAGERIYKQAFYGETAESDARRHASDEVSKALYANA